MRCHMCLGLPLSCTCRCPREQRYAARVALNKERGYGAYLTRKGEHRTELIRIAPTGLMTTTMYAPGQKTGSTGLNSILVFLPGNSARNRAWRSHLMFANASAAAISHVNGLIGILRSGAKKNGATQRSAMEIHESHSPNTHYIHWIHPLILDNGFCNYLASVSKTCRISSCIERPTSRVYALAPLV